MEDPLVRRNIVEHLPACSFPPSLHPHHEAIQAETQPWILHFTSPASDAASQFWLNCDFPLFCSLTYAGGDPSRVAHLVKLITWFFATDTDDDDPAARGCAEANLVALRHQLILACYAGKPRPSAEAHVDADAFIYITKGLPALHDVWADILPHFPEKVHQRYMDAMKDHLNANRLQAHYRKVGRLPGVDEYRYALRRPTSLVLPSLILVEYALGIELDDETLSSETMVALLGAVTDHVALANDVLSCKAEKCYGDYFNLPCVIFHERAAVQPGFTFAEAMCEALKLVEEVDKRCVQLMKELEGSRLIEKAGVPAFLRGLQLWMAGNVEWSRRTARYSQTCSAEGVVRTVSA